ncbi:MAG: ABC transporter permease subunit [Burkholderiales bacterium]|nr:MAG: ABC transporter permease subunit [Burkholderiales bacterium]
MKNPAGLITSRVWLIASFAFLYIPILTLIVLSFNASPMVTTWGGFSLRWYGELMRDQALLSGLWLSLKIAVLTAISSVILGTMAAFALVKFKKFPGKTLFSGMVNSPLVMPEVIIGLSLLLMLVSVQRALGFPERGMLTMWIGHTLLGLAYATVVISARLREMDPSLEEAAKDLGAKPLQVFFLVTLPLISQSLISAGLLTFTLSLDDVVLSAFLSGPGSTTMPLVIFSRARLGLNPTVNAVATITVLVVGIAVVLASLWIARQERKRAQEQSAALKATG